VKIQDKYKAETHDYKVFLSFTINPCLFLRSSVCSVVDLIWLFSRPLACFVVKLLFFETTKSAECRERLKPIKIKPET